MTILWGIHSDVNQSAWFWNNGTIVDDNGSYPNATTSTCQQLAWAFDVKVPSKNFAYHPIGCSDEAYYICEFECKKNNL